MIAHMKAGLKKGVRMAKYVALAHTLLIPLLVAYCYFAGKSPSDGATAPSERELYVACVVGAMGFGTILLTALHDLGREKKNAKYWPMLAFYGGLVFASTEGMRSPIEVEFNALVMMLAFLLMQIDDCLTARGWSAATPEDSEPLRSPSHDELP